MDQNFIKYNESRAKKRYKPIEGFLDFSKKKKVVEIDRHPIFKMDMLDLNDYLQEILDKYHIVGDVKHGSEFHYSIGTSRNNGVTKPAFIISNIPKDIFMNLYSDLVKAWDNIETRLSHKIWIDYEDTRSWIHPTPDDASDWMVDSHMIIITPVEGGEIIQKKPILQRIKRWMKNEEISFKVNKKKGEMYLEDPLFDKRKEISEILFNLEDCLYEIFDKYHIPEGNTNETMFPFRWWRLNHAMTDPQIMIGRMDMIKGKKIYDDIVKIKPMIEERIGHQITIQDEYLTGGMYNPHTFDVSDEGVISIKLNEYMTTSKPKRTWFNFNEKKNDHKLYIEKLNELENLEDYLQEVFDEFHINKVDTVMDSSLTKLPVYYLEVYQNRICIDNLKETSMLHGENPTRFTVLEYTMRRKNMIEKRLGIPIHIKFSGRNSIYVSVEDCASIAYTPIMIENESKSNTQIEDLEDYLQEFFDKFHIKKVGTSEELTQNKDSLCYIASEGAIVIENIPTPFQPTDLFTYGKENRQEIMEILVEELTEVLPVIEKRLGAYLSFDPHPYGGWISIDIVDLYKDRNGLPYDPSHIQDWM